MTKEEFSSHWFRLASAYAGEIIPSKIEAMELYFDKFKSWSAETFGLVCDKIMDNEKISFTNPLQPSMFFRNQLIVIEEQRVIDNQQHKSFNLYKDGLNRASPYGRRILKFCIAVSKGKWKKYSKNHSEIEGILKEFEGSLKT